MKQILAILAIVAVALVPALSRADTATMSLTVTNGQAITYSDQIVASGWLDKIEVVQDSTAGTTSTVTVATYSGTTAIETFCSLTDLTASTKLVIPRRVGTTTAGVSLTAAANGTNDYTAGTVLVAPYEKMMIGGNVLLAVTGTANDGSNTVTVKIYYHPVAK